jgi:hypothetical protein
VPPPDRSNIAPDADDRFFAIVAMALIERPLPGPRVRTAWYLAGVLGADRLAGAQDVLLEWAAADPHDHAVAFAVDLLEEALSSARLPDPPAA